MNRKLRPSRSTQQIKEEQINFLLEDIETNLEEHKKAIELKDKQLSNIKKVLQGAKKSYDSVVVANKQLKEYVANIKKRYQEYQHCQQQEQYSRDREYFEWKPQKKYKKVVYEEETDSESEVEVSQYTPADKFIEQEEEKPKEQKQ